MSDFSLLDRMERAFASTTACNLAVPAEGVVAVILAYNEVLRFPYFLKHYRELGVSHFVVIDNDSNDGTRSLLESEADVSVISTANPYREYKSIWRQLLCERYLQNRWVIFPDVDELFVYPGWPERTIENLTDYMDSHGYRALFCPMIDMYPKGPLNDLAYKSGESFLDHCPWFDASGYRYNPLKGSHRKKYKTPPRHVFGGTRERLFHFDAKRRKTLLDTALLAGPYSVRSKAPHSKLGRKFDHLLFKLVKNAVSDTAAVQSKIPLLKWHSEYKFSGGVHGIDRQIDVAPDWGGLLHFKYLDDFQSKVNEAMKRQQHTNGSGHYRDYQKQMGRLLVEGLHNDNSALFQSVNTLIGHGLARESKALLSWMSEC